MTARRENRSRSLARLWRLGPARSRGCSPRTPMHPRYRPSARQCAAPLGSLVPWSRIRYAHTLPLAGASLIAGVRVAPCAAASWAFTSHSSRPCGGGSLAPLACTTGRKRPGGGVACRGPAGPRGRVPVWPSSAPRLGPRAAIRGVGCPNPPRYAQKIRTAGVSVPPGPGWGRASRCPPWRVLRPRSYPPPSPPASVAGGGRGRFWLPSPGGGARSTRMQGAGGVRPLPACCSLGPSPRPVFSLPPPAFSLAGRLFPLRLGCLLSFLLSAWRPAVGGPRRPCGRHGIQKVLRMGRTNEGRRDRAGKPYRPPGGWFRALPASLLTLKALPHIGQNSQYSRTG